jgi:hypothetical protein
MAALGKHKAIKMPRNRPKKPIINNCQRLLGLSVVPAAAVYALLPVCAFFTESAFILSSECLFFSRDTICCEGWHIRKLHIICRNGIGVCALSCCGAKTTKQKGLLKIKERCVAGCG